jgi:hypothetical protein
MNVIATYQQTFISTSNSASQTFNFERVYKPHPNHQILITVASVSYESTNAGTTYTPHIFTLNGINEFSGKSTTQLSGTTRDTRAGWFLGVGGEQSIDGSKSASMMTQPSRLMVDDIPITDFRIDVTHFSGGTAGGCKFLVSFNIDVVEIK